MQDYIVTIFERWEHGSQWSYRVSTNNVDALKASLRENYNRFLIERIDQ